MAGGLALQWVFAVLVLKTQAGRVTFEIIARIFTQLLQFSDTGSRFLFGNLVDETQSWGFAFAFRVLPTIIFFSSMTTIGYHLGVLQRVVGAMAWLMQRTLRISGAEALCASANMFLGQTEAPLTIRPYIPTMTRSELMNVMTVGFATVSGSAMAAYLIILGKADPAHQVLFAKHLLAASVMSAPAGVLMAKILLPETQSPETAGAVRIRVERTTVNIVDAAAKGAADGLKLAPNVGAMLIAFLAILAMIDYGLARLGNVGFVHSWLASVGVEQLRMKTVLGAHLLAGRVHHGHPGGGLRRVRRASRRGDGGERVRRVRLAGRPDPHRRTERAVDPDVVLLRCAASRTSRRSASRSRASAAWRRTAGRSWRSSACGRCSAARWPAG